MAYGSGERMNNVRQIRKVIYALKRRLGHKVSILTTNTLDQNLQTGVIVNVERVIVIRKAVVVTAREIRDFVYDLSFIAANKNFTYGGFFDQSQRVMLVDGKDLPTDYSPSLNDRCIYNKTRWEFKELSPSAEDVGWLIKLQHLDGAQTEDVIESEVHDNLPGMEQQASWLM